MHQQDFISALGYVLMVTLKPYDVGKGSTHYSSNFPCDLLALVTIFFPGASFIATDGIALYAYLSLVHPSVRQSARCQSSKLTMIIFIASCLIIPGIITFAIASLHAEGYDPEFLTDTCWIRGNITASLKFEYQILGGKGIEWFSFIFVLCCYVPTVRKLYSVLRHSVSHQSREIRRMLFRLALVPGIFICLRIPSAIHTILMYTWKPNYPNVEFMTAMQSIGDTSQGAANGLLYVVCSDTIHRVFFGGCCCGYDEHQYHKALSETNSTIGASNPSELLVESENENYHTGQPIVESRSSDPEEYFMSSFHEESL